MLYIALDRQKSVGCREVAFCLVGDFILIEPPCTLGHMTLRLNAKYLFTYKAQTYALSIDYCPQEVV